MSSRGEERYSSGAFPTVWGRTVCLSEGVVQKLSGQEGSPGTPTPTLREQPALGVLWCGVATELDAWPGPECLVATASFSRHQLSVVPDSAARVDHRVVWILK